MPATYSWLSSDITITGRQLASAHVDQDYIMVVDVIRTPEALIILLDQAFLLSSPIRPWTGKLMGLMGFMAQGEAGIQG